MIFHYDNLIDPDEEYRGSIDFEVDEDIVVTALQELGYECIYENGKKCFSISLTQKAHSEFETTWN